ncbi:MAG: SLC13 family permease [Bilophila wadsworthia]
MSSCHLRVGVYRHHLAQHTHAARRPARNGAAHKGFGDPTVIMMMFIFVFSATLERYGLAKYISLWFVSRKCVMGKPWRLTFALLLAIAILGGLTSATPAAVIGWSLLYGVFDICGYKKATATPS